MSLTRLATLLFVPGHNPTRFDKALAASAEGIVLDLEDAVAVTDKDSARKNVFDWLLTTSKAAQYESRALRCIRLNAPEGPFFEADDMALCQALATGHGPDMIVIPKVESVHTLGKCMHRWQRHARQLPRILALIETAAGLQQVESIAMIPGLGGLGFGAADLSADLGCEMTWESMLYARGRMTHAAALGRIALLDVPHLDLDDEAGLRAHTLRAKAMGFTGKFSIHPRQVATIRHCFVPTREEVEKARAIVDAADRAMGQVCILNGRMVDEPVVRSARQTLARLDGF